MTHPKETAPVSGNAGEPVTMTPRVTDASPTLYPSVGILTDEMIEMVAVIIDPLVGMPGCSPERRSFATTCARAALTAALPGVIEACAKVAEPRGIAGNTGGESFNSGRRSAANAIRSLIPAPQSVKQEE